MKRLTKNRLLVYLDMFCDFFDSWLESNPDREFIRIAHSVVSKVNMKLERAMKTK